MAPSVFPGYSRGEWEKIVSWYKTGVNQQDRVVTERKQNKVHSWEKVEKYD